MPPIFRHPPPLELVLQILQTTGVQSLHDTTTFLKEGIHLQDFEDLLPQLEPYYIPCKASEYIHTTLTPKRAITILRHILRVHGVTLLTIEKSASNQKILWYQLEAPSVPIPEEGITIQFS